MKSIFLQTCCCLCLIYGILNVKYAYAQQAKQYIGVAEVLVAPTKPIILPTPLGPRVTWPATAEDALDTSKDLTGAIKAKQWWLVAALLIFLSMFVATALKVWNKLGTLYAWILVGVLSLMVGLFAAFDAKGFNWSVFLSYLTAGPTVAWLRDFVKDGLLKKG